MDNPEYYFSEEKLIVAYAGAQFAGIFITYPDETFTKDELLEFFQDVSPTYLIAAKLPEVENLTPQNYHSKLSDLIVDLCENDTSGLDVEYYIPKTLH